jgi:glycosyltransferase involved in cell wall biosynthesis
MKIALIGSRGIPASYGGYETFYEQLSIRLVAQGHAVTVYNRSHWIKLRDKYYKGVRLVRLPSIKSKHLDTITHTFLSLIHALFCNYDIIYIVIVGNSPLCIIPKLFGKKVVLNVDGTDATREKWGSFARNYMLWTEKVACKLADVIIADSMVIKKKYKELYGRETIFIPYGANIFDRTVEKTDSAKLAQYGIEPEKYILFVARLEPENKAHTLIDAFKKINTDMKLVIVGDAPYNETYKQELKAIADQRVVFTGFVYGDGYKALSCNCYFFVLPAGIDGTRPVLLDQMGYGNCVVVRNTPANLEVISEAGLSFNKKDRRDVDSLKDVMENLITNKNRVVDFRRKALHRMRDVYSWETITDKYINLFNSLSKNKLLYEVF